MQETPAINSLHFSSFTQMNRSVTVYKIGYSIHLEHYHIHLCLYLLHHHMQFHLHHHRYMHPAIFTFTCIRNCSIPSRCSHCISPTLVNCSQNDKSLIKIIRHTVFISSFIFFIFIHTLIKTATCTTATKSTFILTFN